MDDVDPVWRIIRALHRAARLQQRATAATTELGSAALGVLNMATVSSATPSAISRELGLPPQTVSRAIAELETAALIQRHADPDDGRSYSVELTQAGRRTIKAFRRNLSEHFAAHLTQWSPDEVADFAARLDVLVNALADSEPAQPVRTRRPNAWR